MNTLYHKILACALPLVGGGMVMWSHPQLEQSGNLEFEPNVAALKGSPYGRTIGLALQGPIVRVWDGAVMRGGPQSELYDPPTEALDEGDGFLKLIRRISEEKSRPTVETKLSRLQRQFYMAKIQDKLELAWEMDPTNFANYAIYQMFLYEAFVNGEDQSRISAKEMSLETIEKCLADKGSPNSLLTAAQAGYDLILTGASFSDSIGAGPVELAEYRRLIGEILVRYDELVAEMESNGRWDKLSENRRFEYGERKKMIEELSSSADSILRRLGSTESNNDLENQS